MSVPAARTGEIDGGLGITFPTSGLPQAVVDQCTSGPENTPVLFAEVGALRATFGEGRGVEAAAYAIERYGKPVLMVRVEASEAHAYSAVDATAKDGTSVITVDTDVVPNDDYEVVVVFTSGGTIGGSDDIRLRWSLDGGRTLSPETRLGTANEFEIPAGGGITIEFAAGTLVTGDRIAFRATAPTWDLDDLAAALLALRQTAQQWEFAQVVHPVTSASADVIEAWLASMHAAGKHKWAIANFRLPDSGESESDYRDAFESEFEEFASTSLVVMAGGCKLASALARRRYRRPPAMAVAALASSVSEEVDLAAIDTGRLPGVSIRDALGNPDEHDELINPGLDDLRACVLRTWDGETGVFVNNPRLISPAGSDFDFLQKRRVMNIARTITNDYFRRRLSKKLVVNKKTGFVTEAELVGMETEVNQRLRRALLAAPKASNVRVVLSRTDAILQPPYPLTGQLRLIPLAYPKDIDIEAGYELVETLEFQASAA